MNALTQTKPDWTLCDKTADLSDVWAEESRISDGEDCTGYFHAYDIPAIDERHECFDTTGYELRGISVTDGYGTTFYGRDWLLRAWGYGTVMSIEEGQ